MKLILSLLLFVVSLFSFSQSEVTLSFSIYSEDFRCIQDSIARNIIVSKIITEEGKAVKGLKKIGSFTSYKCYNEYTIPKVAGRYWLTVSNKEYNTDTISFDVDESTENTFDVGVFYLTREEDLNKKNIDKITITGERKKFVEVEANKTTYAVKDNDFLSEGSVDDALTRVPGTIKGMNGEIIVNGKTMAVYIDNMPTGLSSSDLENLLQSLPASSVEKIEIINNPGASYEANTQNGIINIITNGRALRGINGTANINYRFNKNNKISPSVSLNSRINNISLQLNTGFNYDEWDKVYLRNREFTYFSPSVFSAQDIKEEGFNRFYYFRPSANIKLNEKSTIMINYNFNYSHNNNLYNSSTFSDNSLDRIDLKSNSALKSDSYYNQLITQYKLKLDSLDRALDVTVSYSNFTKDIFNSSLQNNLGQNSYSVYKTDLGNQYFNSKVNLSLPYKKWDLSLNVGGKYSFSTASSLGRYNLFNPSSTIINNPSYLFEQDFDYDDQQFAVYAEVNKNIKKFNITAGLRYENLAYKSFVKEYDIRIKKTLDNLYPSLGLLYKFSDIVMANASYRRSVYLPSYTNLDPNITGYFDEYSYSRGNQNLEPEYYDNYEVSISAFNFLKLSFSYNYTKQANFLNSEVEDNSLVVTQTGRTYHNINNYNISLGVPIPLGLITKGKKFFEGPINPDKISFIYLYTTYNYFKINDYPYTEKVKPMWLYALYSQIILPKDFRLAFFYLSTSRNGIFKTYSANRPYTMDNINLSRLFYNKALKVTVGAQNILRTNKISADLNSTNLNVSILERDSNNLYYIKLSYNFGKLRNLKKENNLINEETNKAPDANSIFNQVN